MTQEQIKTCFNDWFDELRNYITYRCNDPDLATDIVQETFVKIWEKDIEYQQEKTKGLLYKMANDLWISQYRKMKSEDKYRLSLSFSSSNETEQSMHYQELKENYEKALSNMSEKRRAVFLMSRIDLMTYKQISECLEISVKAVEKRMHLALQDLRKLLHHEK